LLGLSNRTISGGSASKPAATISRCLASKHAATVFSGLVSKPVTTVFSSLASKPAAMISSGLASKHAVTVFSVLASKPVTTVFSSLASKLVVTVSPGLDSKPADGFLVEPQNQVGGGFPGLGLKTLQLRFGDLGVKITATISWFGPQNEAGFGISVAPQNRRREVCVGHKSRSSVLLCVEASLARVPSLTKRLARRDGRWCMWHHHGGCNGGKFKPDGSMRQVASDPATPPLPFSMY
jgi:hypothetical protein